MKEQSNNKVIINLRKPKFSITSYYWVKFGQKYMFWPVAEISCKDRNFVQFFLTKPLLNPAFQKQVFTQKYNK